MIISGNQTALRELFNLLDNTLTIHLNVVLLNADVKTILRIQEHKLWYVITKINGLKIITDVIILSMT